ncbi:MAG: O-antigen ligase family protein [Candidatus Aminicenantes bacterium]|nr:O-antigen ligase family protein [Candidatus Aminicenantes bacterium]
MTKKLARLLPLFITLFVLFSMVSISLSQIFLAHAFVVLVILVAKKQIKVSFPPFFWGMIVYCALSILASFFSVNPGVSLIDSKDLLLFLIIPIVYMGLRQTNEIKRANLALLASAYVSIFYSLFTYVFKAAPGERVQGFMGHYMTQAGVMLLFGALALSIFIFSRDKARFFWGLGFLLSVLILILTSTRSAWIGMIIATSVILFFFKPKTLIIIPIATALILFLSPKEVKNRALSIFSTRSYSNAQRLEYLNAGIKIIKEYPIFGTGPNTVEMEFQNPKYGLSEEAKQNVHLHNNILQIAAERGIPTLLVWFVFLVWLLISLIKLVPNKDPTLFPLTVAAIAAFLAHFAAGFFEYNFADAEVAALFFYIITIPFAQARNLEKSDTPDLNNSP